MNGLKENMLVSYIDADTDKRVFVIEAIVSRLGYLLIGGGVAAATNVLADVKFFAPVNK